MSKGIIYFLGIFIFVVLVVPAALVTLSSDSTTEPVLALTEKNKEYEDRMPIVRVYLTKEKRIAAIPLESYVKGVVAAEMPAAFHIEALKAQAMSARTYIMDRLAKKDFRDMSEWGEKAKGAVVTDSIKNQVYMTENNLREKWGRSFSEKMNYISEAVDATSGDIITYQGNPIYAAFFSASNGRTENSEDYFSARYPYLRSVTSDWDRKSPEYEKVKVLRITEMIQKIEECMGKKIAMSSSAQKGPLLRIVRRTEGNRIAAIKIGDHVFSGKDIRTALQLPSTDFSISTTKKYIKFTSYGYGHGVGMSQWGANMMAQSGKSAKDIITHYYQGVRIESLLQRSK